MKTYRMNSLMAGALYFLGTVFGISSAVFGGEAINSIVAGNPLAGIVLMDLLASNSSQMTIGSFLILMMGVSLAAMTVFLYPLFKKDSRELALGMLIFRGALEGAYYIITTMGFLTLMLLGKVYVAGGADSAALMSLGSVFYQLQSLMGPVGTIVFLIGATCLYVSFYRTQLIPRWLSIWGLVGIVPYLAYALLHFFDLDNGIGPYLQVLLGLQEMAMALWLVVKGFDQKAVARLLARSAQ